MNIFELTELQKELKTWFEKFNDLEIDEETLKKYLQITEQSNEQYTDKVKNYYYLIRHYEYFVKNAKEEKERINKIQKTYENSVERLKYVLKESMKILNKDKIEWDTGKVYLKKNPDKLNVKMVSMDDIPKEFIKVVESIDKLFINKKFQNIDDLPEWLEKVSSEKSIVLK